ncbi:sigma-70 family RNA polymerase sigma factor [Mangrovimonas aestuarii]|uniref:sigma-70 family RNA polymerase sigma factor n=1 Tax=Mangrovimonas aestuarii TaxID=3018443 RepID=UPI0023785AB0|nr:sigma-70 family RNA polymerase sigma factor [Mangrovimonas aestuarii]
MPTNALNPKKWVNRYADYLFNYTITRVNDRIVAQDLVQETFLAGLKSMKNFKGQASERTWLVSILKRKIIDHYRRINSKKGQAEVRINYRSYEDEEGDWLEEQVADERYRNIEEEFENSELGDAIYECIDKLPEKQAQVFMMKTIQGLDTDTICNELKITPSNLWVIIHRARTALANCLKDNWFK